MKEIKDLTGRTKKGKLKFIKNMSDEGRPRHRKGPKKQSVRYIFLSWKLTGKKEGDLTNLWRVCKRKHHLRG